MAPAAHCAQCAQCLDNRPMTGAVTTNQEPGTPRGEEAAYLGHQSPRSLAAGAELSGAAVAAVAAVVVVVPAGAVVAGVVVGVCTDHHHDGGASVSMVPAVVVPWPW